MDSLTFEQWVEEFKPLCIRTGLPFKIGDPYFMDECFIDLDKDPKQIFNMLIKTENVWTMINGDGIKMHLAQGFLLFDRLGWVICKKSHAGRDVANIQF